MKESRNRIAQIRLFLSWLAQELIDGLFLIGWVALQWLVDEAIDRFALESLDTIVLNIFQILFAFSTIVPVVAYFAIDSVRIYRQTRDEIRKILHDD